MSELHELHELPLANRIIDELVRDYLDRAAGIAYAGTGEATDEERGARKAIAEMRHLHLDSYPYALTPKILDALRRAGLLRAPEAGAAASGEGGT
jgi:hypothetical protein